MESCLVALQARLKARNGLWARLRQGLSDWDPNWVPDEAAPACAVCPVHPRAPPRPRAPWLEGGGC